MDTTMWINHFALLPHDESVQTSVRDMSLVITSSTTGGVGPTGNKCVYMGLQIPPGFLLSRVRVCYALSNSRSFIRQIRIAQVADPPVSATVILDDPRQLTNPGPVCVNGKRTEIDPSLGALLLYIYVQFGDNPDNLDELRDEIRINALGLQVRPV
jgi:hypothetical protein